MSNLPVTIYLGLKTNYQPQVVLRGFEPLPGTKHAHWFFLPDFKKDIKQKTVLALFENSLAGLEAIHKQGLVHMDPFLRMGGTRFYSIMLVLFLPG